MVTMSMQEINVSSTSSSRPLTADAVINLDHGDLIMYEPFWQKIGDRAIIVIPGSQIMSYFSNVSNICWFLEPKFAMEIHRIHRFVGNAITENQYIVVGTGSTQLFQTSLYALLRSDAAEPMSVVSAIPYYSDATVAKKMTKFIEINTIAKIMKVVSDGYELQDSKPNARLFDYGQKVLAARWEILKEVVKTKGMFSLPEYPLETYAFYWGKLQTFLPLHG